jgi:hypothetical protein
MASEVVATPSRARRPVDCLHVQATYGLHGQWRSETHRRPEHRRLAADDLGDNVVGLPDLIYPVPSAMKRAKVMMIHRVIGDLMALGVNLPNQIRMLFCESADDEEGGLGPIFPEDF